MTPLILDGFQRWLVTPALDLSPLAAVGLVFVVRMTSDFGRWLRREVKAKQAEERK